MLNRRVRWNWRLRDDRGAVAVIVSILAVVLFGIGAMAVDLGNGYARRRASQTDADLAAMAGGTKLPNTAAALTAAYDFLQRNVATDDNGAAFPPVAQFTDGIVSNGEICFPSTDDPPGQPTTCANDSTSRIRVVAPPRTVKFGLANAIGFSNVNVTATATVALRSPASNIAPFALPIVCASGQQQIKDPAPGPGATLQWHSTSGQGAPATWPTITGVAKSPSVSSATTTVIVPAGSPQVIDVYGTLIGASTRVAIVTTSGATDLVPTTAAAGKVTVTIPILPDGRYYLQVSDAANNKWSDQLLTNYVDVGSGPNVCNAATGDFGLIDTPRVGVVGTLNTLVLNIAKGADHLVIPFVPLPPLVNTKCTSNGVPVGAILDTDPTASNANCLDVENGNKVSDTTYGLITGKSGVVAKGRLDASIAPPTAGCNAGNNPTAVLSVSINNDVLSCFLQPTFNLKQINGVGGYAATPGVVKCSVMTDARFLWVPVFDTDANPPNGFWPIVKFVGAFITDETPFAAATSDNGIAVNNGTQKVTSITAYVFPQSAFSGCANIGPTVTWTGTGPSVPVLIN